MRALFAFLLLFPAMALGQVNVRSGEHADFSRLVFDFPTEPDWTLGRVDSGYELRVSGDGQSYNFIDVFRFIPKRRVKSVEQRTDGTIWIETDCECHADAFIVRGGALVVDVKDGAPNKFARFEEPLPTGSLQKPESSGVLPALDVGKKPTMREQEVETQVTASVPALSSRTVASRHTATIQAESYPAMLEMVGAETSRPMPEHNVKANDQQHNPAPKKLASAVEPEPERFVAKSLAKALEDWNSPRASETREGLIRQLGRAATQGMILTDALKHSQPPEVDKFVDPSTEMTTIDPNVTTEKEPQIQVLTVIDRDNPSRFNGQDSTDGGRACMPNHSFDLASWGDGNLSTLGGKRAMLLEEFDEPNPAALQALIQRYLHLGFGTEALALMDAFDAPIVDGETLRALAEIMDDLPQTDERIFGGQDVCESDVALWAVLALGNLNANTLQSSDAIVAGLSGLPEHLQEYIGTRVADIFLEANDANTATTIRNIIARNTGPFGPEFALLQSRLSGDLGQSEDALSELRDALQDSGPKLAPLVVELIQTTLRSGQPIDAETAALAEALAFENRGTPTGAVLAEIAIRGLISSGSYEKAFTSIDVALQSGDISEVQSTGMLANIHLGNAINSDNMEFLNTLHSHANSFHLVANEFDETRQRVARRLLSLGFANQAKAFLGAGSSTKQDKTILAEIEVHLGNPTAAQHLLSEAESIDDARLWARIKEAMKDPAAAEQFYIAAGMPAEAQSSAWRSGNWEKIREAYKDQPESAEFRAASHALANRSEDGLQEPEIDRNKPPSLARGKGLIESSENARNVMQDLLG